MRLHKREPILFRLHYCDKCEDETVHRMGICQNCENKRKKEIAEQMQREQPKEIQ